MVRALQDAAFAWQTICRRAVKAQGAFDDDDAALAAGISFLWFRDPDIAAVMAVAMFANMVVAGLSGTLVPLGLVRAGVDPAVASSVFITTITDVVGFFVFLGLAALYLIQ